MIKSVIINMMTSISISIFVLGAIQINAQTMSAKQVLENSIQYHDPKNILQDNPIELKLNQTRPNKKNRLTSVFVGLNKAEFSAKNEEDGETTSMSNKKGTIEFEVNGVKNPSPELLKKYKLTKKRFENMHNYYRYLWFAPLILKDPGTRVAEEGKSTFFNGKEVWEIRVTYDPSVGSDIWYFYFDKSTYAMQGYRFYHDESQNDGEYIILEGEVARNGIKIPESRKWYMHQDDKYLGNDILLNFSLIKI